MKPKEWKCPLGHWSQPRLLIYQGLLGLPNELAICQECGVAFDPNMVEKRDLLPLKEKKQIETVLPLEKPEIEIEDRVIDEMLRKGYVLNLNTGKWEKETKRTETS